MIWHHLFLRALAVFCIIRIVIDFIMLWFITVLLRWIWKPRHLHFHSVVWVKVTWTAKAGNIVWPKSRFCIVIFRATWSFTIWNPKRMCERVYNVTRLANILVEVRMTQDWLNIWPVNRIYLQHLVDYVYRFFTCTRNFVLNWFI